MFLHHYGTQGQYLNLHSCSFAQHFSSHKNKLLVPQGNQLPYHSQKTPSTLLLWRLHSLINVLVVLGELGQIANLKKAWPHTILQYTHTFMFTNLLIVKEGKLAICNKAMPIWFLVQRTQPTLFFFFADPQKIKKQSQNLTLMWIAM